MNSFLWLVTCSIVDKTTRNVVSIYQYAFVSEFVISISLFCSSREAVNRIYQIKGRKLTSPLAICVGDVSDIKRFAFTNDLPETLLDALLPGPVTLVLRRGLWPFL